MNGKRDVCQCVFCEVDFSKNGERYVGRWTNEKRQLTGDYWNPNERSGRIPFARAMVFGRRHALTFGTRGNGPVRLVPKRLVRKRVMPSPRAEHASG